MAKEPEEDISDIGGYVPYMHDLRRNLTFNPGAALLFLEPRINFQPYEIDIDVNKINPLDFPKFSEKFVSLLNKEVLCLQGLVIIPKLRTIPEALEYFRKLLLILNLIGVPSNFMDNAVMTFYYIADSFYRVVEHSRSHYNIGDLTSVIEITEKETMQIIESCNKLYSIINKNEFLKETSIHEFLARGKRAFYNNDHRISFVYNWIFLEATLTKLWEETIIKKYGSKKKAKQVIDNKNWTIQIKTEELFLLGKITKEESQQLNTLRKKRNSLFHFDIQKEKRRITLADAKLCLEVAHDLFYKELGLKYPDDYIDCSDVRDKISKKLTRMTPSTITIK